MDVNLDGYNQELWFYPFMVKLDRFNGSSSTFDDTLGRKQNTRFKFNCLYTISRILLIENINRTYIMRI